MISTEHAVTIAKRLASAGMIVGSHALARCSRIDRLNDDVYLSTQATPNVLSVGTLIFNSNTDTSRAVTVGYRPFVIFHRVSEVTIGAGRPMSWQEEHAFGLTIDKNGLHGFLPFP